MLLKTFVVLSMGWERLLHHAIDGFVDPAHWLDSDGSPKGVEGFSIFGGDDTSRKAHLNGFFYSGFNARNSSDLTAEADFTDNGRIVVEYLIGK